MIEDRSMVVQPHQRVTVDWVYVDLCILGSRARMTPEAVEKKWRKLLQQGDGASWPPIVGHWDNTHDRAQFVVDDGRHEFVASLMMGRERILACWLENQGT